MENNNIENLITKELVREVFNGSVVDSTSGKWMINVCGKVINIGGKAFFDTREQAVRAFYNAFSWRAGLYIGRANCARRGGDLGAYYLWGDSDRAAYWKAFKKVLAKDYGFKIVRV